MRPATLLFLALAACSDDRSPAAPPPADARVAQRPAPDARAVPDAAPDAAPAARAAAVRCRMHGEPLGRDCAGAWGTIAVGADGRVHVVAGSEVRRYRRREGAGCELELEGAVAVPAVEPKPQVLGDGPVYMQSGGPSWKVTGTGGRVFLHELLRGVHEIVGEKVKPVCPELQGVGGIAVLGKRVFLARNQGEELGKRCRTSPAGFDPRPSFGLYAVGDALVGDVGGEAVLYDGDRARAAELGAGDSFAPGGLCSVSAVVGCGGDVCVADGNCKKLVRYGADGRFTGELEGRALFERPPMGLLHAAAAPGGVYLLVLNRDGEICEEAVHWVEIP